MYYPRTKEERLKEIFRMQEAAVLSSAGGKFIPHPWVKSQLRKMSSTETYKVYKYTRLRYEAYLKWLDSKKVQNMHQLEFKF